MLPQQSEEKYKGFEPLTIGLLNGAAMYMATSTIASALVTDPTPGRSMLQMAISGSLALMAGAGAYNRAQEAQGQFEQNQATMEVQSNIISDAEAQGLIRTHVAVEKGPAF